MRRFKSFFIFVLVMSLLMPPYTVHAASDSDVINWLACIVSTHLRVAEGRRIQDEIKKKGYSTVAPELLRQAMTEVTIDFNAIESSVADTFYSLNPVKQFNYHQLFEQYMDTDFQISNDILKDMAFDKFVENARSDGALRINGGGGSSIGGGAQRVFGGGGGDEPTPTPKPTPTPEPTPTPTPTPTPEPTEAPDSGSRYSFDSFEVTRSHIFYLYRSKDFGSSAHNSSFQANEYFFKWLNASLSFNSYYRVDYVYEVTITTSGSSRTVGSYVLDNSLAYSSPVSGYYKIFFFSYKPMSFEVKDAKTSGYYPSVLVEHLPEGSLFFDYTGPTGYGRDAWTRFQHSQSGRLFGGYSGNPYGYITGSVKVNEYRIIPDPVVPITPEPTPVPTPPPANYIINLPDYEPTITNNNYYNNYYIHEADQYTTVLIEGNTTNNDYGDYSTTYQDYITNNITNNNYQTSNVTIINNYTEINNYNTDDDAEPTPTPTPPPTEPPEEPGDPGEAAEGYFTGFFSDIYDALTSRFGFIAQISDAMEAVSLGRAVTGESAFGPGPVIESGGETEVQAFSGEGTSYDVYKDYNNYDVPVFEFTLPERYGGGTYQLVDFSYFAEYRLYIFNFVRFIAWFIFFKRTFRYLPNIIYR